MEISQDVINLWQQCECHRLNISSSQLEELLDLAAKIDTATGGHGAYYQISDLIRSKEWSYENAVIDLQSSLRH